MLDKNVPYASLFMTMPLELLDELKAPSLPAGFRFKMYQPGDESHWADITLKVDEFPTVHAAHEYFAIKFAPGAGLLPERMIFVVDDNDRFVGTACAWMESTQHGDKNVLHWVAVDPAFQRKGIGRALVTKALQIFKEHGLPTPVLLHTQTWSHAAIKLYQLFGFTLCPTSQFGRRPNELEDGLAILQELHPGFTWLVSPHDAA